MQRVVLLTGDIQRVARAIARQVGVDEFYADLLRQDKVRVLKELKRQGAVAMVGDGVMTRRLWPPPISASRWAPPEPMSRSKPPMSC